MSICLNCGNLPPDGVKFCNKCGSKMESADSTTLKPAAPKSKLGYDDVYSTEAGIPFDAGDFGGMEVIEDPDQFKKSRAAGPPTGLGFSADGFHEADQTPAKKDAPKTGSPAVEKQDRFERAFTEAELLELGIASAGEDKGKLKRLATKTRPYILFGAGAALTAVSLIVPWFYLFEGEPLSAWRLPAVFLFADRADMLPKATAGIVAAAALVACLVLAALPKKIVSLIQVAAVAVALLGAGAALLGVRHWNAASGLGAEGYAVYLEAREPLLPDGFAPLLLAESRKDIAPGAAPEASPERAPAGSGQAPGLIFFAFILGPGAAFAFAGGLLLFRGAAAFPSGSNLFDFDIPSWAAVAAATFGAMLLAFALFIRVMPELWQYGQSEVMRAAGRTDAATARLETCVEMPIPRSLCKTALAKARRGEGRSRDAHILLAEVLAERPDYPAPRKELADIHFAGANYWKAAEEYRKYYQLRPGDIDARRSFSKTLVYIGNERYGKGRFADAVRFYTEAFDVLESNKTDTALLYKTGDAYYQMGKLAEALKYLGAAAALLPDKFDLQIQVAKVCEEKGDFDRAIDYYKKSIDAKPDNSISFVYIARIHRDIYKDAGAAAEWYRKGIDANSVSDGAATARRELENLK